MKKATLILIYIICLVRLSAQECLRVIDINPGISSSNPDRFTILNNQLIFSANDGTHGEEVWTTDGTVTGTHLVKDIYLGNKDSKPAAFTGEFVELNGELYFPANDSIHGYELWKTDGTNSGTILTKDISEGSNSSVNPFNPFIPKVLSGELYFPADDNVHGYELWKTDGTDSGTTFVKDIYTGNNSSYAGFASPVFPSQSFAKLNGELLFSARDSSYGYALWKTDGTDPGTSLVKYTLGWSGLGGIFLFGASEELNGNIFFEASDSTHNGYELWKTDGTDSGTVVIRDEMSDEGGHAHFLTKYKNELFFEAFDTAHGFELWKTNGTDSGTVLVKDINQGKGDSRPARFKVYNNELFFSAFDSVHGAELWKTDGTDSGTVLVKDINPGMVTGFPNFFGTGIHERPIIYNNFLYFSALDSIHGYELWRTDGTDTGTVLVWDIIPGPDSSSPKAFTVLGNKLVFQAKHALYGNELTIYSTEPLKEVLTKINTSTGTPLKNSKLLLVGLDISDTSLNIIDSMKTNINGMVSFIYPSQDIWIKAIPDSTLYPNEMPTYYNLSLTFDSASKIILSNNCLMNLTFSTIEGQNPGGSGFIGGKISEGAGKVNSCDGSAVSGLTVILINDQDQPVTYAITDAQGNFSFNNIALGTYTIWVDYPFVDNSQAPVVTIDNNTQPLTDLSFILHKTYLELCTESYISQITGNNIWSVYPNPYSNNTNITYTINETSTVLLEVYNTLGEKLTVLQNSTINPGTYTQQFSGKQLGYSSGIYIVKLTVGDNTYSQRLIELE